MTSHLGRPKTAEDKKYSLEPVGKRLSELLKAEVILVEEPGGDAVKQLIMGLAKRAVDSSWKMFGLFPVKPRTQLSSRSAWRRILMSM
jgi:hypothetical protein